MSSPFDAPADAGAFNLLGLVIFVVMMGYHFLSDGISFDGSGAGFKTVGSGDTFMISEFSKMGNKIKSPVMTRRCLPCSSLIEISVSIFVSFGCNKKKLLSQ